MKLDAKIGRLELRMGMRRVRIADEHQGWSRLVGCELGLAVAAFFRDANGRQIFRVDDASGSRAGEARITPGDDGADGFGCVAFATCLRGEGPADFRQTFERWQVALVVSESNLSDKIAGRLFFKLLYGWNFSGIGNFRHAR